jgi:peptidoglycan/LPS O-acetylase OafA/YrhL
VQNPATAENVRIDAFDGVRGVAIVLVVLSHGWALWPTDGIAAAPVMTGLLNSGNTAVTVFFTVGAYFLTRSTLPIVATSATFPWRVVVRRFIRLSAQVYPLLVAIAVVSLLDSSDQATDETNRRSIAALATYAWNWLLLNDPGHARPDLGHLWYASVDLQVSVGLVILVWLLRRRLRVLAFVLLALVVAIIMWRAHVLAVEGWFGASLRTTTRSDALVGGALVAVVTGLRPLDVRAASTMGVAGLAGLAFVIAVTGPPGTDLSYLGWAGTVATVASVCLVAGLASDAGVAGRVLGARWLGRLGTLSLAIYVWHYPVFWAVARHSGEWHWAARTAVAFAVTAVVSVATERFCERPTRGWLRGSRAGTAVNASKTSAAPR